MPLLEYGCPFFTCAPPRFGRHPTPLLLTVRPARQAAILLRRMTTTALKVGYIKLSNWILEDKKWLNYKVGFLRARLAFFSLSTDLPALSWWHQVDSANQRSERTLQTSCIQLPCRARRCCYKVLLFWLQLSTNHNWFSRHQYLPLLAAPLSTWHNQVTLYLSKLNIYNFYTGAHQRSSAQEPAKILLRHSGVGTLIRLIGLYDFEKTNNTK